MLNSAMVLRCIQDIPTFFALYLRYPDINRQMWMQNLMQNLDDVSMDTKANKKRTKCQSIGLDNKILAEKSMRICTKADI